MNHCLIRFTRLACCGIACALGMTVMLPAQEAVKAPAKESSAPAKKPSLDEKLLDDLGSDLNGDLDEGLLDGLGDLPKLPAKPSPEDKQSPSPAQPAAIRNAGDQPSGALDDQLLDELSEGEDIQLGEQDDPLTRIAKRMQKVEQLIGGQNTSRKTQQLQQGIVDDLATLIQKARQQQQKSPGSGTPNQPTPRKQGGDQPEQKPGEGKEPQAGKEGSQSTDRIGKGENAEVQMEEVRSLMKRAWGHYPDRVRAEMLNASVERFLPKYEKLIEDYFKRLAEEDASRP